MIDEELAMKDTEEFDQLRKSLLPELDLLNKKMKYKVDLKKIKKEAMKNMIEGPSIS